MVKNPLKNPEIPVPVHYSLIVIRKSWDRKISIVMFLFCIHILKTKAEHAGNCRRGAAM